MTTFAILHLSDLHLLKPDEPEQAPEVATSGGAGTSRGRPPRPPVTQKMLLRSLHAAVEGRVRAAPGVQWVVVITGDLFQSVDLPVGDVVAQFEELIARLRAAVPGAHIVLQPGNHDRRVTGVIEDKQPGRLFDALAARRLPGVTLCGRASVLAEVLPPEEHGLPVHLAAFDSTLLPRGWLSAGGVMPVEDLLRLHAELEEAEARDEVLRGRPLVLLVHHHLVPTPITDGNEIDLRGQGWPTGWILGKALPNLVAFGNREELTMTAMGAGTALSMLHTLGRPVIVLHGHKHYPAARLLSGTEPGDADVVLSAAGSAGMAEQWSPGGFLRKQSMWPSFNEVRIAGDEVTFTTVAFPDEPPEPDGSSEREEARERLKVKRVAGRWERLVHAPPPPPRSIPFDLDQRTCWIEEYRDAPTDYCDVISQRRVTELPGHPPRELAEMLRCAGTRPGKALFADGTTRELPHRRILTTDHPPETIRIYRALCRTRAAGIAEYGPTTRYEWLGFLVNYGARRARLELHGLPHGRAATAFASVLDLTSGVERPAPLIHRDGALILEVPDCPPKRRLRIFWVLP